MKPRSLIVAANDIYISGQFQAAKKRLALEDAANLYPDGASTGLEGRGTLMLGPFRKLNYSTWKAFRSLRAWFSMERFLDVKVQNRMLPLSINVDAAWVDDSGRTLDQIVRHGR